MRTGASWVRLALAAPLIALTMQGPVWAQAASEQPKTDWIVISGAPSEVSIKLPWFRSAASPQCTLFYVFAGPSVQSITLTTTGLGQTQLAATANGACPADSVNWDDRLALTSKSRFDHQPVALRVPAASLHETATLTGEIVAFGENGQLGSAPLKIIVANRWTSLLSALQWGFGLVIPALLGFFFALNIPKLQNRSKAREDFLAFKVLEVDAIGTAIHELKIVINTQRQMEQPGRQAYLALKKGGVLEKLPNKERRRLVALCAKNEIALIAKRIRELFPDQAGEM